MRQLIHRYKNSEIARRLVSGFGANLLGKVFVALFQLLSVPILSAAWGLDGLGVWLMISAIPSYLYLSDFGLATTAAVDMTKSVAVKNHTDALRIYQTSWVFVTAISATAAACVAIGLVIWVSTAHDGLHGGFTLQQVAGAIALQTLGAMLGIQTNFTMSLYQATNKYALGQLFGAFSYAFQGIAVIIIAMLGGKIAAAAAASCAASFAVVAVEIGLIRRLEPWVRIGTQFSDRATLRGLLHPSAAAFALTAANSFGLHSVVLAIGFTMGPTAAAVFATVRMMTRTPLQFAGLLTRASLPELTRSLNAKNHTLTHRLMQANIVTSMIVMVPSLGVLVIWGPALLSLLSHGGMKATQTMFALLGIAALLNVMWTTLGTRLMAMNRQAEYAWIVLAVYGAVAAAPFFARGSLLEIGLAMVIADGLVTGWIATRKDLN